VVVVHPDRQALDIFARELGSVGLSFAPGTTGLLGGRPKPAPQIRLFTFFVEKSTLKAPTVSLAGEVFEVAIPAGVALTPAPAVTYDDPAPVSDEPTIEVPLLRLALARSGDKADSANIAIIARDPAFAPIIRREVTPQRMAEHFRYQVSGRVQRFEAPGLNAFNFLLEEALGGGGMASLRIDFQGKAYGQMALEMLVKVPAGLLERVALG
jgi:hypothetical protein